MTNVLVLAALVTPLIVYAIRRMQNGKMRSKIADEGFETASDVLYPNKRGSLHKFRVGPVLPH